MVKTFLLFTFSISFFFFVCLFVFVSAETKTFFKLFIWPSVEKTNSDKLPKRRVRFVENRQRREKSKKLHLGYKRAFWWMRCKKVNRNSKQKKWRKKLTCVMNKNKRKNAKEKKY
jgi:hypothetical protein